MGELPGLFFPGSPLLWEVGWVLSGFVLFISALRVHYALLACSMPFSHSFASLAGSNALLPVLFFPGSTSGSVLFIFALCSVPLPFALSLPLLFACSLLVPRCSLPWGAGWVLSFALCSGGWGGFFPFALPGPSLVLCRSA